MKPLGRKGKYYSVNCPRRGNSICSDCAAFHIYMTKGKSRTQANKINRTIQKRQNILIIEEYEEEMNEGI